MEIKEINEPNTPQKKTSTIMLNDKTNNELSNIILKDTIQTFNKIYDSNFLIMINELAISIQNYHKNYVNHSNLIKAIFNEIENENENEKIIKIKNEISQIDSLSSKFYSDAKISFKKMKFYRNNIIKNINQQTLNIKHKKSSSLNIKLGVNNTLSNLDTKMKYNNDIIINKDEYKLTDKLIEEKKKETISTEFLDKIFEEIKEYGKLNDGQKSIQINYYFDEFLKEQKNKLINFVNNKNKNENEIIYRPSTSRGLFIDDQIKKKIEDLTNNINELENENNKIKNEFQKYKSDEKIKRKFLETQILNISSKEKEYIKNLKTKEKEFNDKKNEYEEKISQLKSEIVNLNNNINDYINENQEIKINSKKILEEKIEEMNKMNDNHAKILKEKELIYKNECRNKENKIEQIKKELDELIINEQKLKKENEKVLNDLNEKEMKIKELSTINDEKSDIIKTKENAICQITKELNDLKIKNSELNRMNSSNNKKILSFEKKVNEYEKEIKNNKEELDDMKLQNNSVNQKYEEINKNFNSLQSEMSKIKQLNEKYNEAIIELEKENKEINNLLIKDKTEMNDEKNKLNKKIKELQNEINQLNKELDVKEKEIKTLKESLEDKNDNIQEYKNKYENEIKKIDKLEKKIQELEAKEEEGNMTEYEKKKRKIPNRSKNINSSEIENIERKFRFLYNRTMENFSSNHSRNSSKTASNSLISNNKFNYNKNNNNNTLTTANESKIEKKDKNYNTGNIQNNNNICYDDKSEISTNMNNIEYLTDNSNIKITPENYSFIKCYQLNNKLRWCLFKKNIFNKKKNRPSLISQKRTQIRKHSLGSELSTNNLNLELESSDFNDFIWLPYKTSKDFKEFGDISAVSEYSDVLDYSNDYRKIIRNLETKLNEKEKECNKLDNILIKLMNENKNYKNNVEKLMKENCDLNNQMSKFKTDLKNDKNFIGVSFIDDDPESSKFIDDKCCEDILIGLEKEKDTNKIKKKSCYNTNLKSCIDMLMSKVVPSENIRSILASILRQLGCSDEDIYKLIGNYRGVIAIPFSFNKYGYK